MPRFASAVEDLTALGADGAAANARLDDEIGRLSALHRYDILDTAPEASFDRITALVRTILDVPMAAVSLVDRDRQWFKSRDGIDLTETSREISFCTHMISSLEPMVVVDARDDPRFRDNPLVVEAPNIVSYAGAPLISRDGYNLGSLCALDRVPREFTAAQVDILVKFSALVVDEFELRNIATWDHLTGARSRRSLLGEAARAIAERARSGAVSTMLLFDIDHFKSVNDRLGHAAGDLVLRAISQACSTALRTQNVFGRVGGEEFAVLVPDLDTSAAMTVAERLREVIGAMTFGFAPALTVTSSFGVAPLTDAITTPEEWLAAADVPLFEAKRDGRNCCRVSGQSGPLDA